MKFSWVFAGAHQTSTEVIRFIVGAYLSAGMNKLEAVNTDTMRESLADASTAKAVKRLMIALAYADGVGVETLSERYDIPRATVYSWLDRFEQQSISEAVKDESRPGRPSKFAASQRDQLSDELAESPAKLGYDTPEWTPEHAQHHIEQTYGVTYSLGHVRRSLREFLDKYMDIQYSQNIEREFDPRNIASS
jgi:transposase